MYTGMYGRIGLELYIYSIFPRSLHRTWPKAYFADFQLVEAIQIKRDSEEPAAAADTAEYTAVIIHVADR